MLYQMLSARPDSTCPREELHYLDSAALLLRFQQEGYTRAEMARMTGMTVQQVADRLCLSELDEGLQVCLRRENMPERIALCLTTLPDALTRRRMALRIARERLCIRDAVLLIASAQRQCSHMRQEHRQQVRLAIRDVRPYRNAIRDIAGQMRSAGLQATFTEQHQGRTVSLTVAYSERRRRMTRYHAI